MILALAKDCTIPRNVGISIKVPDDRYLLELAESELHIVIRGEFELYFAAAQHFESGGGPDDIALSYLFLEGVSCNGEYFASFASLRASGHISDDQLINNFLCPVRMQNNMAVAIQRAFRAWKSVPAVTMHDITPSNAPEAMQEMHMRDGELMASKHDRSRHQKDRAKKIDQKKEEPYQTARERGYGQRGKLGRRDDLFRAAQVLPGNAHGEAPRVSHTPGDVQSRGRTRLDPEPR